MGDSDLFSLELPGTLTSKKSSDSLHLDDSMTGIHPLDEYSDSPRESRRRPEKASESRAISAASPSYRGVDFGGSAEDYVSPDEYLEEDGPLHRRRGLSALGEEANASTASITSMEYFDDRTIVADFLRQYNCTSMMPQSSKVVVLDNGLSIRAAFHALDENDIDSATTWDAQEKDYDGVVTIGDLIAALLEQITDPAHIDAEAVLRKLETLKIKQWMAKRLENRDLVCMEPSDSLFEALSMLSRFKVHRVPVIDRLEQNTILYVLTATKIVVFLMKIMAKRPALFETSLEKIQVGLFGSLTTAPADSTLYDVLQMIEKTHFSAIPITSPQGVLIDTLYKTDLSRVSPDEILASLNIPVPQVLLNWRQRGIIRSFGANTCTTEDNLEIVLARLIEYRMRSLVIVDMERNVKGIIALTDILRCFLV